ncbi:DNA methylase, partial [Salmonella enterica]|nr:DNA methylase [Salmonella enterica]
TNSGAPNIRELYEGNGFKVHHMAARRSVSCKASTRVVANDIIAIMK